MSEQNSERPLTRREMRMREQSAAETVSASSANAAADELAAEAAAAQIVDVVISPYDADGVPRSRREMRQLREAAIQEQLAANAAEKAAEKAAESAEIAEPAVDELAAKFTQEQLDSAEVATAAFSLADIEQASTTVDAPITPADADAPTTPADAEPVEEEPPADAPVKDAPAADPTDALAEAEPADAEAPAAEPTEKSEMTYSFPDITPLSETNSVFDDPARGEQLKSAAAPSSFDDLINRAVVQEGSTGPESAALILPAHPDDTAGLTGPLGSGGELFMTGSLKLPKSLGETGSHLPLQRDDAVDALFEEAVDLPLPAASSGQAPVSARSAVSAQHYQTAPVVAAPAKDRSKKPLILALSGGGLLLIISGVVVLALTQGWFA